MAKFVFKMQNLLDVKIKLEGQAKTEFSLAANRLKAEEEKLEQIYQDIENYYELIRAENGKTLDIQELKRCTDAIEIKKLQAQEQKKEIKKAERILELARENLNKTMVDRKTYEVLKDKAFEEFKMQISNEEKKEIDELVSFKYSERKD